MDLIEGVLVLMADIVECIVYYTDDDINENENSGSPFSFEGLNITKDVTEANYEKNIYHELRHQRFMHTISKEEYKSLVAHQKKIDEINRLVKDFKNAKYENVTEAIYGLEKFKDMIDRFYKKGYISNETNEKIQSEISKKNNLLKDAKKKEK